ADTVASGTPAAVPGSDREMVLALPAALPDGDYRVEWRAPGADGHVIRGDFAFTVAGAGLAAATTDSASSGTTAPDSAAAAPPAPAGTVGPATVPPAPVVDAQEETHSDAARPLAVLIRWGGFLALLGMIGAVAFRYAVLGRMERDGDLGGVADRATDGAWYLAFVAAALSGLTLALRLWAQSAALHGGAAFEGERISALLFGTLWGMAWVLQAVATVAFVVGLAVARAPHGRSVGWMGAGVSALLLATVPALSGHAAAVEARAGLAILTDTLHVLGAGVWLGTLTMVLLAGLPATLPVVEAGRGRAVSALLGSFSPVALAGAAVAGVTGVLSSLFHVSTAAELVGTTYGRMLLVKLGLLVVVAALGLYNWRVVVPRLEAAEGARALRRSAGLEIAFGLVVVLVTATLVALPTPGGG
ncbi:MAG TPA: CopD family protein, partial [Longimicrobium sp.]|nr:CopD family protein [Longimicrobium sp.]